MKKHGSENFFLYLSYNAPHYARTGEGSLQAPEEWIRKFAAAGKPTKREIYSAMVACMDDGIGRLMAALREQKIDQNTLVIFMSDNGADPAYGGSNFPLSGHKRDVLEGGVRVPMVACWPGAIPAGTVRKDVVHMADFQEKADLSAREAAVRTAMQGEMDRLAAELRLVKGGKAPPRTGHEGE